MLLHEICWSCMVAFGHTFQYLLHSDITTGQRNDIKKSENKRTCVCRSSLHILCIHSFLCPYYPHFPLLFVNSFLWTEPHKYQTKTKKNIYKSYAFMIFTPLSEISPSKAWLSGETIVGKHSGSHPRFFGMWPMHCILCAGKLLYSISRKAAPKHNLSTSTLDCTDGQCCPVS